MTKSKRHLTQEELESLSHTSEKPLGRRRMAHVETCAHCREELSAHRLLSSSLANLATFEPAPDFASQVMARVTLPAPAPAPVPLRTRAIQTLRDHWLAVTGSAAGAGVTAGVLLAWAAQFPQSSPAGLVGFVAERTLARLASAALNAAQWIYQSGLASAFDQLGSQLSVGSAIAALATLTLMGIGSLSVTRRLMEEPTRQLTPAR
ncbi:MAG: hypothetical protein ABFS14_02085 [Gemmatimonadota bacterium]